MKNKLTKQSGLKKRDIRQMKRTGNFTLLELLIVVAILAIIAGGMVGSFTNIEENASQAQAARDIAAVDQAIQIHASFESGIPDNVDSLLSITVALAAVDAASTATANGSTVISDVTELSANDAQVAAAIDNRSIEAFTGLNDGGGLAGKVTAQALSENQIDNLLKAGLTTVRYIDRGLDGNNNALAIPTDNVGTIAVFNSVNIANDYGDVDSISIPQNYFEAPRGSSKNRGRGFEVDLDAMGKADASTVNIFAVWGGQVASAPVNTYNNAKVGANPKAVLVAFGLGPNNSLVGKDAKFGLSSGMPYYANVEKNEYNNYIMLVDVEQRPAKVVAIIDSKGDFRAEEFSEYLDQKL